MSVFVSSWKQPARSTADAEDCELLQFLVAAALLLLLQRLLPASGLSLGWASASAVYRLTLLLSGCFIEALLFLAVFSYPTWTENCKSTPPKDDASSVCHLCVASQPKPGANCIPCHPIPIWSVFLFWQKWKRATAHRHCFISFRNFHHPNCVKTKQELNDINTLPHDFICGDCKEWWIIAALARNYLPVIT